MLLKFGNGKFWWPAKASKAYIGCEHSALTNPKHPHFYEKKGAIVQKGDIVLDCGACEGFFAHQVKHRAKELHLFEPVPILAECLRRTFSVELGEKIYVWEIGLSQISSIARFRIDTGDYQGSHVLKNESGGKDIYINLMSIDDFVAEKNLSRVDFIKVDVEGSDVNVLKGAEQTLRSFFPKVSVATYHQPYHAKQILGLFKGISSKYRCSFSGTANYGTECRPLMAHFWINEHTRNSH